MECKIFLMSSEEQLVNCVVPLSFKHMSYLIYWYWGFLKKSIFKGQFKRGVISSYSWNYLFCKITTIEIGICWNCYEKYLWKSLFLAKVQAKGGKRRGRGNKSQALSFGLEKSIKRWHFVTFKMNATDITANCIIFDNF